MKLLKEAVERVDKEKWNHVALEYEKMAREMEEGEVKQKVLGKINAKMFWEEARKKGEMEKAKKGDGEENKKREERDETEDRENGPEMEVKEEKDVKKKDEEEEKNFKERNFAEGEDEDQKEKGKSAIKGDSFARGLVFQIDLDTLVTGITLKTSYLPVR